MKLSKQIYNTSLLQHEYVRQYLKDFQTKFFIVTIDKALNKFSFICKKLSVSKLLNEIGLRGIQYDIYILVKNLRKT